MRRTTSTGVETEKIKRPRSKLRIVRIALLYIFAAVGLLFILVVIEEMVVEPQFDVWIEAPVVTTLNESFEIRLHVRNKADTQLSLVSVYVFGEYLRGVTIENSDPLVEDRDEGSEGTLYSYGVPIGVGEEIQVTFNAQGNARGVYSDDIDVCIGPSYDCMYWPIRTDVK